MRLRYKPNCNFLKKWENSYPEYEQISKSVNTTGQSKFVKLEHLVYRKKGDESKTLSYDYLVRQGKSDNPEIPDAVSMLPYYIDETGEPVFLISNQYRPVIEAREISLFAGILDPEDMENSDSPIASIRKAVKRELDEECGQVKIKKSMPISPIMSKSAGAVKEFEQTHLVEIDGLVGAQNLEPSEDINVVEVKACDIEAFLEECEALPRGKTSFSIVLSTALNAVLGRSKCKEFISDSIKVAEEARADEDELY